MKNQQHDDIKKGGNFKQTIKCLIERVVKRYLVSPYVEGGNLYDKSRQRPNKKIEIRR